MKDDYRKITLGLGNMDVTVIFGTPNVLMWTKDRSELKRE